MIRFFSGLLLIVAATIVVFLASPYRQLLKPKEVRLYNKWSQDIQELSQDKKLSEIFSKIKNVEVHFTDPQVAEEFEQFKAPFRTANNGTYILKISITRWIEKDDYGFVVQHELFDANDDKLYEFGRTYKIGLIL